MIHPPTPIVQLNLPSWAAYGARPPDRRGGRRADASLQQAYLLDPTRTAIADELRTLGAEVPGVSAIDTAGGLRIAEFGLRNPHQSPESRRAGNGPRQYSVPGNQ